MLERFELMANGGSPPTVIEGRVLVAPPDGVLVEDRRSTLWTLKNEQIKSREKTETPFALLPAEEHGRLLVRELGADFRVQMSDHYLIVSNTSPAYAEWCNGMLERFYAGFFAYWMKHLNMELPEPDSKLLVILLRDQMQFKQFYEKDVGQKTQSSFGYYSIRRNRSVLYDFSGLDEDDAKSSGDVRRALRKVPFNVATMVHEATHQLCFNTGLHTRYADNPVWLMEGLAMYFEAPYFNSSKWNTIGKLTDWRKDATKAYMDSISAGTLASLTLSDDRFRQAETTRDAYTESWALTLYLMKNRENELARYLKSISEKSPLVWDKPEQRLRLLQETIGSPNELAKPVSAYLNRRF